MVTIEVNKRPLRAREGERLLAALRRAGLSVPTLCDVPALFPSGACRLCVVEVEGRRRLAPSCATPVEEGMKVMTHSPRAVRARQTIVELLLANHPDDCLYCFRNGACQLQRLAEDLGVRQRRYVGAKSDRKIDLAGPSVVRDPAKCILCGKCVRVCEEIQGVAAIDFHGRGSRTCIGTAIGTGLAAPRTYIFRAIDHLRDITGLGLARAENLVEATQNTDAFVEVSGILKALASNLLKIATDLRLLSSGPEGGIGELRLPPRQAGSSIMPGKVNPVIPEAVSQAAMVVMANDQTITIACSMGNLELNAFLPVIADALLGSLTLLAQACLIFRTLCVAGLEADAERCRRHVESATASVTALVEGIGYEAATRVAEEAQAMGKTVRQVVIDRGLLTGPQFDALVSSEAVTRLGSPPKKDNP